jgi:prepilin peptidase CpaA
MDPPEACVGLSCLNVGAPRTSGIGNAWASGRRRPEPVRAWGRYGFSETVSDGRANLFFCVKNAGGYSMLARLVTNFVLLLPLAVMISYYDVYYRRIPNILVLATLVGGLAMNGFVYGWNGLLISLGGCLSAFGLMLLLHLFGALGAGDVKLFAAIGAVIGLNLVLPTFVVVLLTGGALAVLMTLRAGTLRETMERVGLIFFSLFVNRRAPQLVIPADKCQTIPYGVAITVGSLVSLAIFRF